MIVVDTNILAYHCLPGPWNNKTEHLLRIEPEWTAPLLWRSEFRNLLCRYLRRGEIDLTTAQAIMINAIETLKGGEQAVSDHVVLQLITQSRCTAYDCEFAALAAALGTVLVTEDKALLAAFPKLCRSLDQMLS